MFLCKGKPEYNDRKCERTLLKLNEEKKIANI